MNEHGQTLAFEGGVADLGRREVRYSDGRRCGLSPREIGLLRYLCAHAGRVVSRDELLRQVWGLNPACTITRTIDMYVSALRKKLRDDASQPALLLTVPGQGYAMADPCALGSNGAHPSPAMVSAGILPAPEPAGTRVALNGQVSAKAAPNRLHLQESNGIDPGAPYVRQNA